MGDNGLKEVNIADGEGLEGLNSSSNLQKIEEATDFDNAVDKFATKNSNLSSNSADRGIVISNSNNIYSIDEELVPNFKQYLLQQKQSHHTIRNKIQYVKRFYYVLKTNNAQDLLLVSHETRQHAMK